ncbi:dihydrouridine synthase, DuS [Moraxella macacae 0408225]|uniref:tRNA-dihydrouridine(16) synthase n=2 Tax=Moraxella macacae TaxID=765840 RepID=L2F8Z9_9GAMM|nr:dihydrouridine synthase, DuS [Moraxella macacae 0408225]
MEGLTDPVMRSVLTSIGKYDWSVSEFIRVTQTVLPAHVFYKHIPELKHEGEFQGKTIHGTPVHVQLLGSNPHLMADNAAKACELNAPAIDLNFGCPAKTVNNHRGGSVLLTEPDTVYQIVHAVRQAVPTHIPVSAKIRLGYEDTSLTEEIGDAIQAAKANWLTVHARTKTQGYKPPAYWDLIAPLSQKLSIPVIANGEIWTLEQACCCRRQAGTLHLMLGRGAVTYPDLVNKIKDNHYKNLTWQDLLRLQIDFLRGNAKSDNMMVARYKQWLAMLTQGYPQAKILWQTAKRIKNLDEMLNLLNVQLNTQNMC